MTEPMSTDPFQAPPPLGDDIADRTRHRARMLLMRRRLTAAGAALCLIVVTATAFAATRQVSHPQSLRTITSPTPDGGAAVTAGQGNARTTSTTVTSGATTTTTTTTFDVNPSTGQGNGPGGAPGDSTTTSSSAVASTTVPGTFPLVCPSGGTVTVTVTLAATQVDAAQHTWLVTGTVTLNNDSGGIVATMGWVNPTGATRPDDSQQFAIGWHGTDPSPTPPIMDTGWAAVDAHSSKTWPLDSSVHVVNGANARSLSAPTAFAVGRLYGSWYQPYSNCEGLTFSPNFSSTATNSFPLPGS